MVPIRSRPPYARTLSSRSFPPFFDRRWSALLLVVLIGLSAPAAFATDYSVIATPSLLGADPIDSDPYGIVLHPNAPLGYVAHAGTPAFVDPELANGSTVSEIDLETLMVLRTFDVGFFPTDLAISSDGAELFAVTSTSGTVAKIDLTTASVVEAPLVDTLGTAVSFPVGILLSPDESQLWVTSNGGGFDGSNENVIILDPSTLAVVDSVDIFGGVSRMAVRADGRAVVPVGFPGDVFPSEPQIRIYDTTVVGWNELASFTLDLDIADFPAPADVVFSADGASAYVSVLGGSTELFRVDVETPALLTPWSLPGSEVGQHGLALTEAGTEVVVTDFYAASARVLDATGGVVATIPTGAQPNEVVSGGGRLWITDQLDESLTVALLPGSFTRGDANLDEIVNLADGVAILLALFGGEVLTCEDAGDVNDDGLLDLSDPISLFTYLFASGGAPSYPFTLPGRDMTDDALGCSL